VRERKCWKLMKKKKEIFFHFGPCIVHGIECGSSHKARHRFLPS
jgi:hypothetical protein